MKKFTRLNREQLADCATFQKKCLESFGEISHGHTDEINFEIFGIGIGLVISNIMLTFGIKDINHFLNDMVEMVKHVHEDVKKNASYMEYKKGVKISEGHFN